MHHAIVRCEQRTRNKATRRERVRRLIEMNRRQDDRKITFDEFTKYCDKTEA